MNPLETKKVETVNTGPQQKDSSKTLYDLVVAQGYNFKKIVPYLAESFGVCTKEEYKQALTNHDVKKNTEYNLKIRKLLLSGKSIEPPDLKQEVLEKFDNNKKEIIKKQFGLSIKYPGFMSYINGLDSYQTQQLNQMSEASFQSFLSQQAYESQNILVSSPKNINAGSIEQIKNLALLTKFEIKFREFKEKNPSLKNVPEINNEELEIRYASLPAEKLANYSKVYGDKENVKRALKQSIDYTLLTNSQEFKALEPEKKQEFTQMMSEYYTYNESIGLGEELKEIWGEEIYLTIQNISVANIQEETPSSIEEIKNDVISDKDVIKYFEEHTIKTLVTQEEKDEKYYTNLRKLYPEVDVLIDKNPQIQKLMKIKTPTKEEQNQLQKLLQEKTKPAEESLLSDTNRSIEKQAVISCLDMIKVYMDIDLTQQENVLDQFFRKEDQKDIVKSTGEGVILDINGTINGKKITLYYNLTTGALQQEEFLSRGAINTPFSINDPVGGKKDIIGIQLPKFQDFIAGAKNLEYGKIMNDAKDISSYEQNVGYELRNAVKKEGVWNMDTEKNIFQKNIFQNIVAQELFSFMGKDKNISSETCSPNQNADIYAMYTMVYNTLHYYTIDELKTLRIVISKLIKQKEKYNENIQEKDTNTEKYLLGLLGNQSSLNNQKSENISSYESGITYASFFSIFKTTEANIPIIDLAVLEAFVHRSESEISKDQSYLDDKEKELNFQKTISGMEDSMSLIGLNKDIEDLSI